MNVQYLLFRFRIYTVANPTLDTTIMAYRRWNCQ